LSGQFLHIIIHQTHQAATHSHRTYVRRQHGSRRVAPFSDDIPSVLIRRKKGKAISLTYAPRTTYHPIDRHVRHHVTRHRHDTTNNYNPSKLWESLGHDPP
jgi:hypothetical protein